MDTVCRQFNLRRDFASHRLHGEAPQLMHSTDLRHGGAFLRPQWSDGWRRLSPYSVSRKRSHRA